MIIQPWCLLIIIFVQLQFSNSFRNIQERRRFAHPYTKVIQLSDGRRFFVRPNHLRKPRLGMRKRNRRLKSGDIFGDILGGIKIGNQGPLGTLLGGDGAGSAAGLDTTLLGNGGAGGLLFDGLGGLLGGLFGGGPSNSPNPVQSPQIPPL